MNKFILGLMAVFLSAALGAATATPTATAVASLSNNTSRSIVFPIDCTAADGVGDVTLAQSQSQTAAVLSTGTAAVRFAWMCPNDFDGQLRVFAYGTHSTITNTVTMKVDTRVHRMNGLTSSATVYLGTDTNVQTQNAYSFLASRMSRFLLPTAPFLLTSTAGIKAGDLVNFHVQKTGGTDGATSVYAFEVQYQAIQGRKP